MNSKIRYSLILFVLTLSSLFPIACTGASAQDVQGLLQAIDGKEVLVTLADGTTARIKIEDDKLTAKARDLVGRSVDIKVRANDGKMVGVERLGEDIHFSGNIESMGADKFVIGGQTFKVDGTTMLDGGLVAGALARVEAVRLPDGTLLATEIETDNQEGHFSGKIESIGKDAIVIGGKTFSTSAVTRLDSGLVAGAVARVEFVTMPNGSLVAIEVETDEPGDGHLSGTIRSLSPDTLVIDGQTIKINDATRFDNGAGLKARVEFIKLADGTLLASKIEFDRIEMEREDLQRREQELRGREQELERHETEIRGREAELRGREAEGEGPRGENEIRGREAEGEVRGREAEGEVRGHEAEGEVRGQEAEAGRGGGDDSGGSSGGGGDDSGGSSGSSGSGSGK